MCWDFSATSTAEVFWGLKNNTQYNFSEANQAVALSNSWKKGFARNIMDSGNFLMSMAYFTRGEGPILENNDSFTNINSISSFTKYDVVASIYTNGTSKTSNYFNSAKSAYYESDSSVVPNHAIQIVGWDNNYSKDNFSTKPSIDGAWIIKNSYGTDFGDNGYMYVSYMDQVIPKYLYSITNMSNAKNEKKYLYNTFGEIGNVSYNTKKAWFSNKFTSNQLEELTKISFVNQNLNVTASIYVGTNHNNLKLMLTKDITNPGYYTFELPESKYINGDFIVAVKFEGKNSIKIPIERNIS
ncbi:MAG: lectin like domain-containing protein, partial [Suipraeoptans sp.]